VGLCFLSQASDELGVENLASTTKRNPQHINDELLIGGQQPLMDVLFHAGSFPSYFGFTLFPSFCFRMIIRFSQIMHV